MGKKKEIPIFDFPIIETHCHLDYLKEQTTEELINLTDTYNIEKIITISVDNTNIDKVIEISNNYPKVFCTQGVHPHHAKECNEDTFKSIRKNLKLSKKIVAIGEIGLDFHYNNSPKDIQIKVFKEFLNLAIETDLPVVIHSRDADTEMIEILNEFAPKMNKKGVIHSFTSEEKLAKCALSHGFHLGFNGIITFNSAQNVRDILSITPIEKILVETDAPFLTPVPYRGTENKPIFLPFIIQKISEVKGVSVEEILQQTYKNSISLFFD